MHTWWLGALQLNAEMLLAEIYAEKMFLAEIYSEMLLAEIYPEMLLAEIYAEMLLRRSGGASYAAPRNAASGTYTFGLCGRATTPNGHATGAEARQ